MEARGKLFSQQRVLNKPTRNFSNFTQTLVLRFLEETVTKIYELSGKRPGAKRAPQEGRKISGSKGAIRNMHSVV